MVQAIWIQSSVESYQRLKKWYLIPPCLTLSNIKYVSRVKWSNPRKGVVPPLLLSVVAIEKETFWLPSTTVTNFCFCIMTGGNTPQITNYTATCLLSWKLSKLDEPDMQDTAGEAEMSSQVMYSCGPSHMAKQKQDDQHEHTFSSYVRIRDVALKTCQRRWTIGKSGKRGSVISMLAARHDDDDDDYDWLFYFLILSFWSLMYNNWSFHGLSLDFVLFCF